MRWRKTSQLGSYFVGDLLLGYVIYIYIYINIYIYSIYIYVYICITYIDSITTNDYDWIDFLPNDQLGL